MIYLQRMNVLFWIRKQKKNSRGKCPIYCRVTVDGLRVAEFSTGIRSRECDWSSAKQQTKDSIDAARLNEIESRIRMAHFHAGSKGLRLNQEIIARFVSGNTSPIEIHSFVQVTEEYLEKKLKQTGSRELSPESYKTYLRRKRNIFNWLQSTKRIDLYLDRFTEEDLDDFATWMKSTPLDHGQPSSHNYVQKHIQLIKSVYRYARSKGYIQHNPAELYKLSFQRHKITTISLRELDLIRNHQFASLRLQHVADLFIFQCKTGLAYSDLQELDNSHIEDDEFIIKERKKTGQESIIPFLPAAKQIWQKYSGQLPRISNVKYNAYLKEVAEIVGIEKKLTTHVGRKTFGQIMADRGISMDVISRMLGHSNIKTTQAAYVGISTKRMIRELLQTG